MKKLSFEVKIRIKSEPRLLGDILTEMLSSKSPLATGYRQFVAKKQMNAEKGGAL